MINIRRTGPVIAAAAALLFALTACGPTASSNQGAPAQGGASQAPNGSGAGGQRQPGVTGKIAAVSGRTLQVQGQSGQTAVTYTKKTALTQVTDTTAKALEVGMCATIRTAENASASPSEQLTAGSVILSDANGDGCQGGFGGGNRPAGAPSGAPSDRPSAASSGTGRFGGASGKVLSVDGETFVVQSRRPDANGQPATTKITVTTSADTTWSQVTTATAKMIAVGGCATAMGKSDDTGAMTATSLRLSKAAKDGTCATGFGGGRPPRQGQGNG